MIEEKSVYKIIQEEAGLIPTEELPEDLEFTKDFLQNNKDIQDEVLMVVVSAYTRYFYNRVYKVVM